MWNLGLLFHVQLTRDVFISGILMGPIGPMNPMGISYGKYYSGSVRMERAWKCLDENRMGWKHYIFPFAADSKLIILRNMLLGARPVMEKSGRIPNPTKYKP